MINAAPNARGALGLPSRAPGRRLDAAVRSRRLGRSSAASTKPRQVSRRAGEGDGQPKAAEPFNIPAELGILALRLGTSTMMFHNGLDKLKDPEGFSTFVVGKYLDFLPEPLLWTYAAIAVELACPVLLALGVLSRPSAAALLGTMCFAITFHLNQTGLEGFPLAVVENHQYAFETSSLYAGIFFYFLLAGPGKISLRK